MDTNFAAVTFFTLLFAVCTARISLDSQPHCKVQDSDLGSSPRDTNKPPENLPESGKDRINRVDLTPRSDFARFHAINRRFFDAYHSRPHRHFQQPIVITPSKISHAREDILTRENGNVHVEKFHRDGLSNRLRFEHDYRQHQHQHQHQLQQRHHSHKDDIGGSMPKHKFVRDNVVHQHKVETREQVAGFMKSIRKFLKHSLD